MELKTQKEIVDTVGGYSGLKGRFKSGYNVNGYKFIVLEGQRYEATEAGTDSDIKFRKV